ncbi:MAG: FecR family protein [Deltaproteobacteria bacterium]|nr:FecR family protein [Deltaproteobacteria bacterium]
MNKKGIILLLASLGMAAMTAMAGQYGEGTLEEGNVTILRNGKPMVMSKGAAKIAIMEKDLIRMGAKGRMVIQTNEKAVVTLGPNAILHVEPWSQRDKKGNVRMLFGRFRTQVSGLVTGEQFNVKTATATIGVKGTEYVAIVSSNGNTTMIPVENVVQLEGLDGLAQDVTPGQMSVVINGQRATQPTSVPSEVKGDVLNEKLAAPSVESTKANLLPGEVSLVEAGIIDESLLVESKVEEFTMEEALLKPIGEMESLEKDARSFSREAEIK